MTNVLQSVCRLAIVTLGMVILFIADFTGWWCLVGLLVIGLGGTLIVKSARAGGREARRKAEIQRFDHVQFGDEGNPPPKSPWAE